VNLGDRAACACQEASNMNRTPSIAVEGIQLRGRCGVSAEERAVGQGLVVDVRLEPATCAGAESDALEGTVDYSSVVDAIRTLVEGGEYRLLERLATVIADVLWGEFSLVFLEVVVTKPSPPVAVPVRSARVEVVRTA
jgi:dihydroneopterin aldolase